jgi:signal peptidase I
MKGKSKRLVKTSLQWLVVVLVAVVIAAGLRLFVFAAFSIPSDSMAPAMRAGDYVLVSKLVPGPRWVDNFLSLRQGGKPRITRFRGYRPVRRNDVLVFNFPHFHREELEFNANLYYAKRCVALPGDTFYIEEGIYKVAGVTDTLGSFRQQQHARSLERLQTPEECFPGDSLYRWNRRNFGPLYLPARGDSLDIDTMNARLYGRLIAYETGKVVTTRGASVVLGDSVIRGYRFEKDYYFMAGDLVYDSVDSRYWGPLPGDHIVGKVSLVLTSREPRDKKFRWNRFLKRVR